MLRAQADSAPQGLAVGEDAPGVSALEAGELHISYNLYLRIVDLCGWPAEGLWEARDWP